MRVTLYLKELGYVTGDIKMPKKMSVKDFLDMIINYSMKQRFFTMKRVKVKNPNTYGTIPEISVKIDDVIMGFEA